MDTLRSEALTLGENKKKEKKKELLEAVPAPDSTPPAPPEPTVVHEPLIFALFPMLHQISCKTVEALTEEECEKEQEAIEKLMKKLSYRGKLLSAHIEYLHNDF